MPSEEKSSGLERANLLVAILGAVLSFAASAYGFFAYERAKRVEETIQARLTTELQALELGRKSAFDVQSEGSLSIQPLGNPRTGERQFWIVWSVSLSNHGNRTVSVVGMVLKLYKGLLPGGATFAGELNPPWRQSTPIQWTEVFARAYERAEGGLDDYSAVGPMSPADRRYGEVSFVVRGLPEEWAYATAEVSLKSNDESDKLVEWDYRQIGEIERRTSPSS